MLNPGKKGAHNPAYILPPSPEVIEDWSPENGVRLVTMAPEIPGALDVIRELRKRGVVVSAGHSLASYDEAVRSFDAGITKGTHLFNAQPPLDHRQPGLSAALLTDRRVSVGLIADGIHVHPAMIDLAWRMKGPRGVVLVTDAMAALGMPPGNYHLGDYDVIVDAASARLLNGTLAGSILTHDTAVRNLMNYTGCSLAEALAAASLNPGNLIGLESKGRLEPGADADLILLNPGGQVMSTLVAGQIVYQKS
jgi:N-acetylglucosamine-6-phosphate deacetylase